MKAIHFDGLYLVVFVDFEREQLLRVVDLFKDFEHPNTYNRFWADLSRDILNYPPSMRSPSSVGPVSDTLYIDHRPLDWKVLEDRVVEGIEADEQSMIRSKEDSFQRQGLIYRLGHRDEKERDLERIQTRYFGLVEKARQKFASLADEFPDYHMVRYSYNSRGALVSNITGAGRSGEEHGLILGEQSETEQFMNRLNPQNAAELLFGLFDPEKSVLVPYSHIDIPRYEQDPNAPHGTLTVRRNFSEVDLKTMKEVGKDFINTFKATNQVVISDYRTGG